MPRPRVPTFCGGGDGLVRELIVGSSQYSDAPLPQYLGSKKHPFTARGWKAGEEKPQPPPLPRPHVRTFFVPGLIVGSSAAGALLPQYFGSKKTLMRTEAGRQEGRSPNRHICQDHVYVHSSSLRVGEGHVEPRNLHLTCPAAPWHLHTSYIPCLSLASYILHALLHLGSYIPLTYPACIAYITYMAYMKCGHRIIGVRTWSTCPDQPRTRGHREGGPVGTSTSSICTRFL